MKSLICSIALILSTVFLQAQTTTNAYPIKQGVANSPTTEAITNAMYGKFIIYSYADTTAANTDPYIKHQAFAFISTTSPIGLWYRDLTNTVWLQLSVSGSPTVSSWLTRGNDLSTQSLPNRLGTKNGDQLNIITTDLVRAIIPAGGIVRSSSTQNRYLVQDTVGKELYYDDIPISSLTAARATNDIDNGSYQQIWRWTGMAQFGLSLEATTTAALNNSIFFSADISGANAVANRTTHAAKFTNTHTGTNSTNRALTLSASGGSTNIAMYIESGTLNIGGTLSSENGIINIGGSTSGTITLQPQAAAGTYNWNWPTTAGTSGYFLTSGGGGSTAMTWTQNNFLTGLTVGTTTISSGTTTRILYDNAGVLGEYTLTGTGTVVAMQTAPTFITSITSPLIIGGTGTTSTLTYKTTTGAGDIGADHIFLTGDNGGTEAMRILNSGNIGIGTATPNSTLHVSGSLALKYLLVEVNEYAITEFDYTLSVNNGASDWSIVLPDASTCPGRIYIIKRYDNNSTGLVTVDANSCDVQSPATGSFNTTFDLTAWGTQNQSVMFQSNGSNWEAIK